MNPKTPQDLDPKLKEAYERVMGSNINPGNVIPPKPSVPPPPPSQGHNAMPSMGTVPMPQRLPPLEPVPVMMSSPTATPAKAKKKSGLLPIIFLIVGILFFAGYAVVWAKFFGLF